MTKQTLIDGCSPDSPGNEPSLLAHIDRVACKYGWDPSMNCRAWDYLDDTLRAEIANRQRLQACNDAMRAPMKRLRELVNMPAQGEGSVVAAVVNLVAELRGTFDWTRHRILERMGEKDFGHGWDWVESKITATRKELDRWVDRFKEADHLAAERREMVEELLNLCETLSNHDEDSLALMRSIREQIEK